MNSYEKKEKRSIRAHGEKKQTRSLRLKTFALCKKAKTHHIKRVQNGKIREGENEKQVREKKEIKKPLI